MLKQTSAYIRDLPGAFWVVIGATLINTAGTMAIVLLVLYLTQYLHFSLPQASFAFAAFGISMLFTGVVGGVLVDYIGAARVMAGTLFLNGIVLLCFPLEKNYFSILLMCSLWGFIYGMYRPASQTFVSFLAPVGSHKITFSIYRLAVNLGMSLGPAIGGYLATHSFAAIFIVNGAANLLASIALTLGLFRSPWFKYRSPLLERKIELSIKWLKRDAALRWFVLGMVPISMVFFQHESTLSVFLTDNLHLPLSFYGLLFTINTLVIVFCELPLNIATISWSPRFCLIIGSLLITIGFTGFIFVEYQWQVILMTLIWTTGEMILYPSASTYITEIAPEKNRGSYMAIYSSCSNMGMFLGPWLGGLIMHQFTAKNLWLTCGVWGLLSVVIFYFLSVPKK